MKNAGVQTTRADVFQNGSNFLWRLWLPRWTYFSHRPSLVEARTKYEGSIDQGEQQIGPTPTTSGPVNGRFAVCENYGVACNSTRNRPGFGSTHQRLKKLSI